MQKLISAMRSSDRRSAPLRTTMAVPSAALNQQQQQQHQQQGGGGGGGGGGEGVVRFPTPAVTSLPSLALDETNTMTDDDESQTLESGTRYTLDTFTLNSGDIEGDHTFDTIGDDTTTAMPAHGEAEHNHASSTAAGGGALFPNGGSGAATGSPLILVSEQDVLREKRQCLASSFLFFVGTLLSFSYCWLKNTHGLPLYPELVLDLLLCLAHTAMVGHVIFFEFASLDGGFQCDKHLQTRRSLDHMRYAQTVSGKRPFSREIRVVNMAQSVLFLLATFVQAVALISVNSYYHQEQELQLQQMQAQAQLDFNNSTRGYHGYFYYHNYNNGGGGGQGAAADYTAVDAIMDAEERDRLMGTYNWLTFVSSLFYFFSAATILVVHAVRMLFDRLRTASRTAAGNPNRQLLHHVSKQPPKKLPAKISVTPTLLADIAEHRYSAILTLDHAANALYFVLTTSMLIISISALSLEDPDVRFFGDLNLLEIIAFLWVWIGALYFVADVLRWSYTPPRSCAAIAADNAEAAADDDETNPGPPPPPFKSPPSTTSSRKRGNDATSRASRKADDTTAPPPLYIAKSMPFPTSTQYIPAIEVELDVRSLPPCRGRTRTPRPKTPIKNQYVPAIEVELDVRGLPSRRSPGGWPKAPPTKNDGTRSDESQGSVQSNANNDNVSNNNNDNDNNSIVNIMDNDSVIALGDNNINRIDNDSVIALGDNDSVVDRIDNDSVIALGDNNNNNMSTTNSDDDSKNYRSSRDPDGVLQDEISNNTSANQESKDPPSSMLIVSESLIEYKPSQVLASATSLCTSYRGDFNPDHHDAAAGRDASDPIQIQYMAMSDYGDNDNEMAQQQQHADNEDDIITFKRGSLSMDTACSAPPSPPVTSLTTTGVAHYSNNNNNNEYINIDYVAMRDSNSPIRTRMTSTEMAHVADSVDAATGNNSHRSAYTSIRRIVSTPECPLERFSDVSAAAQDPTEAVTHRFEAQVQGVTKRNNNDGNDDDNNGQSHYEYNRMDYASSLRQNYFALPEHRQEQNEQDQQDKSTTSRSLRKTPSPSVDGVEVIQVDGRKHAQLRWKPYPPLTLGASSSPHVAADSSCSGSTRSGPPSFGRPPQQRHQHMWSSSSSAASWSQSQQQQNQGIFNNSDHSHSHDGHHHQRPQQEQQQEQQQLVQEEPETIDLTTAVEDGRDDGLEYNDHDKKDGGSQNRIRRTSSPTNQNHIRRTPSPTSRTRRIPSPTRSPLSWTSIEDRKYQQAQKQKQQHRNNATSPTQYHGRFGDHLDHFIDPY